MADLKAYLAAKYMTGAKADAILDRAADHDGTVKRRKKKRKVDDSTQRVVASGGGLVIADDDGMSWVANNDEEDDEARPVVEERKGFFKAKASGQSWATVREGEPSGGRTPSPEPVDEDPVVVSTTTEDAPRGGLQSAAQLRAEGERRRLEQEKLRIQAEREIAKRKKEMRARGEDEDADDPTATVYRDSSGRKIDMKLEKAEKARIKREEMEKEMKKMEWGKGIVQKEDKERERLEQEAMLAKPLARFVFSSPSPYELV